MSDPWEVLEATDDTGLHLFEDDAIVASDLENGPALEELRFEEPVLQEVEEATGPLRDLAERLEHLARRLLAEDVESLLPSLARGDRLDMLVAGFLAGYLTARNA